MATRIWATANALTHLPRSLKSCLGTDVATLFNCPQVCFFGCDLSGVLPAPASRTRHRFLADLSYGFLSSRRNSGFYILLLLCDSFTLLLQMSVFPNTAIKGGHGLLSKSVRADSCLPQGGEGGASREGKDDNNLSRTWNQNHSYLKYEKHPKPFFFSPNPFTTPPPPPPPPSPKPQHPDTQNFQSPKHPKSKNRAHVL